MNVYLVARKSCSDAAMAFWKEANISGLNLNQSSWADRLPMMCSWSIVRGGRKCLSNSECFGAFWRACSTVELANSLPGLVVQKWKLSILAESTCESFNNTVLPFILEAKGTESCYFQPG